MKALENTINWFFVILVFIAIASFAFSIFTKTYSKTREEFGKTRGYSLDVARINEITIICNTFTNSNGDIKQIKDSRILTEFKGYSTNLDNVLNGLENSINSNSFSIKDGNYQKLTNFCFYVLRINDICSNRCDKGYSTCFSKMFFDYLLKKPQLWNQYMAKKIDNKFDNSYCIGD